MDVPRVMSTQHPDNVSSPFFARDEVLEGEDEIEEAFYAYSHLGCDEQMWDFEGKEGDEYAVKKLLSRYTEFFVENNLGSDVRLTLRGPNPDVEETEAKILLEILESIPRSFDAAYQFYDEIDEAPIHEVIIPMVTSENQLHMVYRYYRDFVAGKQDLEVWDGRSVGDWMGEFNPGSIDVIPLIEDREHMMESDEILEGYMDEWGLDSQRVFLARSDPALNYGSLSAVLINKVALQRLYDMAERTGVRVHPILGAGPPPFRGNLNPGTVDRVTSCYREVETFTVQSSFKYDNPIEDVRRGIDELRDANQGYRSSEFNEERVIEVIDRVSSAYSRQVDEVAGMVNQIARFVPKRRARKLHIGLFGYSRDVGERSLPRAITYTASLYSIGFPPEMMGLSGLRGSDLEVVEEVYPGFFEDLGDAVRYFNDDAVSFLGLEWDVVEPALDLVDVEVDEGHREVTDEVMDRLESGDTDGLGLLVERAGGIRGFLG